MVSPTHIYSNGTYMVYHRIIRYFNGNHVCQSDTSIQLIVAQSTACNLSGRYINYQTDSVNPLKKQYFGYMQGYSAGDSLRWSFGDGTFSNDFSPVHIYATGGIRTVCLRVKKQSTNASNPPCIFEFCRLDTTYSNVTNPCNLQAYFTADSLGLNVFHFNNYSNGYNSSDSIRWSFGDGTSSNIANPTHTYLNAGVYNVCLRIIKNSITNSTPCISEYCHTINVSSPCSLVSNFTFYRDSTVTIPNSYHFTNTSAPLNANDSIRWTFGDGTSSNQINPNHAYAQPGTYNVCLRVIKRAANGILTNCSSEVCHVVVVNALPNPCNLQVYFSDSINVNFVHFTNQSIGYASGDSITWIFGDGSISHDVNPNHTYTNAGTYTVCLIIKKNTVPGTTTCIRQYCKTITITAACTLVANFTWYRDSIPTIANNSYHFTNTSAPLNANDSIRWTFGDGTSSNQINPNHVYAQAGNYNVCLRVIKRAANGILTNCVSEICRLVVVPQPCNLVVSYTHNADSANNRKIYFTNTTNAPAPNTVLWSFGDGTTATTFNATHEYLQAGRYYVCLRVQYGTCITYKCDSLTVTANLPTPPACSQLSQYSFVRSATNNNIVSFSPSFIDNNVQYTWTFGDGTGSQIATPTHHFANIGYYTVCLTAFRNNGCASTTCKSVYIASTVNCNSITLGFNDVADSLVPNRIRFFATSNTAITNQLWTIAKLPATATSGSATIYTNNPTYVFLDSGNYRVCLKVTFAGGCVKEFCKIIHIAQQMPFTSSCTLQVYPNPTSTNANAQVTLAQPLVLNGYIYNSMNMLVAQKQQQGFVGTNAMSIYVGTLPAGIYSFRMLYGNQVCTSTFVKL